MRICKLNGFTYKPVTPQADNEQLADNGPRLMLCHGSAVNPASQIFIARQGVLSSGWVIGIEAAQELDPVYDQTYFALNRPTA